jgi:hypothetical protein
MRTRVWKEHDHLTVILREMNGEGRDFNKYVRPPFP